MKRLLWPDSLRGRLIIIALFCLVLFQAVNTATLFFVQHQQRMSRLTLLASQTAEWYTILNGKSPEQRDEMLAALGKLYNHKDWRLEFEITPSFPDPTFLPGTEGPIAHARPLFVRTA